MATIGGGEIVRYSFTKAWGVNPAVASGEAVVPGGGTFSLQVGNYVVYSFGSYASFAGILTDVMQTKEFAGGISYRFEVADNRLRLAWQTAFGAWNIEDDLYSRFNARPEAPGTGSDSGGTEGADDVEMGAGLEGSSSIEGYDDATAPTEPWTDRRRYRHMLPENVRAGIWTFSDEPLDVREVLNSAFNHAWGSYAFSRSYPTEFSSSVILGMDYRTGIKLSNLVAEVNARTGMEVAITGTKTLFWGRKGVGTIPLPDSSCDAISQGDSLTASDTARRIVGDPMLLQKGNIDLEPDWVAAWQPFIDELAWIREVADAFEMESATKSDFCELAAFAKRVTVFEYAKKKNDVAFLDYRPFGQICRNSMPAWAYITELVYRSYRIPPDFKLRGIPLSSLEIYDGLLCEMELADGDTGLMKYATPVSYYPPVTAQAIGMGQPLDLVTANDIRLFYRRATKDLSTVWSTMQDFEVDRLGKSIRFATPVFIDGQGDKSIYLFVNRGEGGGTNLTGKVGADSDYLDVVVPNPAFEIRPAQIRAAFCFQLGLYTADYGSGPRRGSVPASGLAYHLLDTSGGATGGGPGTAPPTGEVPLPDTANLREILYRDGAGAKAKADAIAASLDGLSPVLTRGGFTRHGVTGTALTPVIDRITVDVSLDQGVTERVEFAKARSSGAPFAERTLERIQRTEELFSGEAALKTEVRQLQAIANALRTVPDEQASSHATFAETFTVPAGSTANTSHLVRLPEGMSYGAGEIVWLDDEGKPGQRGTHFGGVAVAASGTGAVRLAVGGRVPVRIAERIAMHGNVFANPGDSAGKAYGQIIIGKLAHGEATPDDESGFLALVDMLPMASLVRFRISYDPEKLRLHVGPGMVVQTEAAPSGVATPREPLLDGDPLSIVPFWDVAGKTPGVPYRVICRCPRDAVPFMELQSSYAAVEPGLDEWIFDVGLVTWKMVGSALVEGSIIQLWGSDITIVRDDAASGSDLSDSSGSSDSFGSSDSPGSDASGSSKDTAVVQASWTRHGFAALFALESPDVRFVDWVERVPLTGRVTRVPIDPRFIEVCVPGSLRVFGVSSPLPYPVGVRIEGGWLIVTALPLLRPPEINLTLVGIRAGFDGLRFPARTRAEFAGNERRLNLFKPRRRRES
jgi:hypothetical protein